MNNRIISTPRFIATSDPLALAALIEAGLQRPGHTIIELGPPCPPTPFAKMPAAKRAAIREMIARIKNAYYGVEDL